jgi:signal transduction histidine kinase
MGEIPAGPGGTPVGRSANGTTRRVPTRAPRSSGADTIDLQGRTEQGQTERRLRRPDGHRRPRIIRSRSDRILTGLAAGLGDVLGVDHVVIRLAFVVLAFAGGVGLIAYLLLLLVSAEDGSAPGPSSSPDGADGVKRALAVALVVAGTLLLLRAAGVWFGDAVVWPVALGAAGSALIWARAADTRRARWTQMASRIPRGPVEAVFAGPVSRVRVLVGGLLIGAGVVVLLAVNSPLAALRNVAFAVAVTLVGVGLIVGPGLVRLGRQLAEERRERIRSEERAEMAAHLHDSVLQSLALIQRARTPEEMAALARRQERELRGWLYGRIERGGVLATALEEAAARVERMHHVKVEVVVVGDCPVDERLDAVVQAAGEAMMNAAKHAGVSTVSVFAEVEPDRITTYVRDQGRGFDPKGVEGDRRGIAQSIVGRMERAGGTARVESAPGEGTEVRLRLPREPV